MLYKDPREALQDVINGNQNIKDELIKNCAGINPEQSFYSDYVLIQEDTLKTITRTLLKEFHPDKSGGNDLINPNISNEIAQIINSSRESIERSIVFNYPISDEYYNFLIESNPYAFIRIIKGREERRYNYNWYDNEETYNYYKNFIKIIDENFPDIKLNKQIKSIEKYILGIDRKKLEKFYIDLFLENEKRKIELDKKTNINISRQQISNGFQEIQNEKAKLRQEKELLELKKQELENLKKKLLEEGLTSIQEARLELENETNELYTELFKKEEELRKKGEKLASRIDELDIKEREFLKKEEDLISRENILKEIEESLKIREIIINQEKARNEKIADDTVESMLELTSYYESKFSPEKLFSDKNLDTIRTAFVYAKNSYYEKLLSEIKRQEISYGDIDYIDFKNIESWHKVFKNTKNIFLHLETIFINISRDFSLEKLSSKTPEIKKLTKRLNYLEKKEFFTNFLETIINKVISDEKIILISSLSKIKDNIVYEGAYRNLVLDAINNYIRNIKELENIINNEIFGKNYVKFENEFKEFREIIKMGELLYLHKYKFHYSKLNDEKGGITQAFLNDLRNPVEDVIFDIEKILKIL